MNGILMSSYFSHDIELLAKEKPVLMPTSIVHAPLPRQQFGVSLE